MCQNTTLAVYYLTFSSGVVSAVNGGQIGWSAWGGQQHAVVSRRCAGLQSRYTAEPVMF